MPWIDACATDDIDEEDLIRWDHAGKTFAIYHSPEGEFFADSFTYAADSQPNR